MQTVRRRAANSNLSKLTLTFVLPHENRPVRLPVVPATHTALMSLMADGTIPIYDSQTKRGFLCRDACFPLWMERLVNNSAVFLSATGSATTFNIPAGTNRTLILPVWSSQNGFLTGGASIDGTTASLTQVTDLGVLGKAPEGLAFYIPPGSTFNFRVFTGAAGGGNGIEFEVVWHSEGDEFTSTMIMAPDAGGFSFVGVAGGTTATTGTLAQGLVPKGFARLSTWRTRDVAPTAATAPLVQFGWASGGSIGSPSGSAVLMLPFTNPPELVNSQIPFQRTRLNSSAALLTNVTAALSKEGTILAARLKADAVDPWSFNSAHLNSVHPSMRYYGPLEKGLYTFSSPTANLDAFDDHIVQLPVSPSSTNLIYRPCFMWQDVGIYNAFLLSDLGSSAVGTQMAVSVYSHLEFETTSSLFAIGVSTARLEDLHAAEVALLRFGHFHENPLHWAALAKAAVGALKFVAPMVAPVVEHYGTKALKAGVAMLRGPAGGDRKMSQANPFTPRQQRAKPRAKPRAKSGRRK